MTQSQPRISTATVSAEQHEGALDVARTVLAELFGPPQARRFAVRYWDGSEERPAAGQPVPCTLILRRPGALRRMLLPPRELAVAEAYLRDDFDVEGDLEAVTALGETVAATLQSPALLARLMRELRALPADDAADSIAGGDRQPRLLGLRHTRGRDAAAVRYHYDAGNDFYALWLDTRMVYSCAYFPTGAEDLDAAQTAKLEHICRKLRLKPGERLLDIGCGWGGLVHYAAERYGVQALGVTLSEPQAALARERIASAGLHDRCRIEVRDYRDLLEEPPFDKVVSVGMFEHVGRAQLPTYFRTAYRLTRPGGLFLNHGIAAGPPARFAGLGPWAFRRLWRQGEFIWRYVFPDGELVPPSEAVTYGEEAGFEIRDVENLREHYALTLRAWVRRLEERHAEAVKAASEQAYRVYRLYMAASAHNFAAGSISLIQALFAKPRPDGVCELPPTRADLYSPTPD